jgi:hypothetical protein
MKQHQGQSHIKTPTKCTRMLDPQHHAQTMETLFDSDVLDGEGVAEKIVEWKKHQRMQNNRNRAKQEEEHVAVSRVKEGWKDKNHHIVMQHEESNIDNDPKQQGLSNISGSLKQDGSSPLKEDEETQQHHDHFQQRQQQPQQPRRHMATMHSSTEKFTRNDLKSAILRTDVSAIESIIRSNPELVHERDENGWESIHEAVRKGSLEVTEILLETTNYANMNSRVGAKGQGGSVLWIARQFNGDHHQIISYLRELGALDNPPKEQRNHDEL